MFETLKITAKLRTGIVSSDYFVPIDAILWAQAQKIQYGRDDFFEPNVPFNRSVDLPLKKIENNEYWYWSASFAQWPDNYADGKDHWSKRVRSGLLHFLNYNGKINQGSGRYKGYRMPVFYRHAVSVSWYAVGNKLEIKRLLTGVTHLGKKCAYGWGRVIAWQVESWKDDWSIKRDGKLMRAVPILNNQKKTGTIFYGYRPEYWYHGNQALCRMPEF